MARLSETELAAERRKTITAAELGEVSPEEVERLAAA